MVSDAGGTILEAVRQLRPVVDAAAPKAADDRHLSPEVVAAMKQAGVFGMAMPARWGGPELTMLEQIAIIEELSYADGAAGWCAMIGCDSGYYPQFLDEAVARSIWDELDLVTAGQTQPVGTAVRDGDGWRISGRWSFGSGITNADRIVGGAFLKEPDGSHQFDAFGIPEWRTFVLPVESVTIHETWDTTGLLGTGSHDYSADDVWVPDAHGFYALAKGNWDGPLYALPWWFIVKVAGVPLGLAQRALDELVALAPTKLVIPEFVMLADVPHARAGAAKARALVGSARSWLHDVIGAAWDEASSTGEVSPPMRADLRLALTHTTVTCREAVGLCFDAAASSSIKRGGPIDRAYRDAATAAQHIVVNPRSYGYAGAVMFGKDPGVPML
jgi:alkylation response protein AidB-like acyl-CoA dehydrogenase